MNPFVIYEPTFNKNNVMNQFFYCQMKRLIFISIFTIMNRLRKGMWFMNPLRLAWSLLRIKIGLNCLLKQAPTLAHDKSWSEILWFKPMISVHCDP